MTVCNALLFLKAQRSTGNWHYIWQITKTANCWAATEVTSVYMHVCDSLVETEEQTTRTYKKNPSGVIGSGFLLAAFRRWHGQRSSPLGILVFALTHINPYTPPLSAATCVLMRRRFPKRGSRPLRKISAGQCIACDGRMRGESTTFTYNWLLTDKYIFYGSLACVSYITQ